MEKQRRRNYAAERERERWRREVEEKGGIDKRLEPGDEDDEEELYFSP